MKNTSKKQEQTAETPAWVVDENIAVSKHMVVHEGKLMKWKEKANGTFIGVLFSPEIIGAPLPKQGTQAWDVMSGILQGFLSYDLSSLVSDDLIAAFEGKVLVDYEERLSGKKARVADEKKAALKALASLSTEDLLLLVAKAQAK